MGVIGEEIENKTDDSMIPDSENLIKPSCIGRCPIINTNPWSPIYFPHTYCDQFCLCLVNYMVIGKCPEGMRFSNSSNDCQVITTDTECPNRSTGPVDDTKGCLEQCPDINSINQTILTGHKKCNKFCTCNWGKHVVFQCPPSLHFNVETKTCDSVSNANCTGSY